jgi:transcription initiation factor TFIID subunit 12
MCADDFVDDLIVQAARLAKLRGSATLETRDLQICLERQYNIRLPGYTLDESRIVKKPQPAPGWAHKVGAIQASKIAGGVGGKD